MKEIILLIYILISLFKHFQSKKQGELNNNFEAKFNTYLLPIYLYNNYTNTSDEQNIYFFSYKVNSSKFIYYVINKRSKEIEYIGDELTISSTFKDCKFISVSFYNNTNFIYYLLEKNNSKYIGVYSTLGHFLIFNKEVNTTFIYNKPENNDLHNLTYKNDTQIISICPIENINPCKIPNKINIESYGKSEILNTTCKKNMYKILNFIFCINECPIGYIKIGNECKLECGDRKYHLNLKKCVSRCDESEIKINKNYCISCEQSNKIKGINSEICVDNCEDIYNTSYIENNQCIKKCKLGSYFNSTHCINCKELGLFLNESEMKCVKKCDNDIYDEYNICFNCQDRGLIYYEKKTTNTKIEKGCIKNCTDINFEFDSEEKKCKQCEDNFIFLKEKGVCIAQSNCKLNKNFDVCEKCLDYKNKDNKCIDYENDITDCNIGSEIKINEKKCINCSTFLYSNGTCVESCNANKVLEGKICLDCSNEEKNIFYENSTCVEKCSNISHQKGNICVDCSKNGKYYYNGECKDKCPEYTFNESNVCRTCKEINPDFPYFNIKNCTNKCNNSYQAITKINNIEICKNCEKLIFNNSCYESDECPTHTFKNKKRCEICNDTQYFFNGSCVDKCNEGYTIGKDQYNIKFCKDCMYYLDEGCIESCEKNESYPYRKISSVHNTVICKKCICNYYGGICKKINNYDKSDYYCDCYKNFSGDFCQIYHENNTKDFYIYSYTKFPPTPKNRVGFKYKYSGKEIIKNITWGLQIKKCIDLSDDILKNEYINGINEDIFILNGKLLSDYIQCNYTIFANLSLNNGNVLNDELNINSSNININKIINYSYSIIDYDNYCPLKSNINFYININNVNTTYNFTFQLLYDKNDKIEDNIYFEFTKEFYYNQLMENLIAPGKNFALKIKSRDGNFLIQKKSHKILKIRNDCYTINDVFNKNDNSFMTVGKLLYLFDYDSSYKNFTLNLTINHLNDIQDFLIKVFDEKLKEEEKENINSEKYNESYYKENYIYKSNEDNFYNIKANSIQLIIRLMLNYLYQIQPNYFEKGIEILSNTSKILFNYKLDYFNIFNISNYLCTTYNIYIDKMLKENKNEIDNLKIFNILFSELQNLTSIISHSMIVGEMFEFSSLDNINLKIEKLGKYQNVMTINNYQPKKKILDECEDSDFNIELCIENKETNNIINEINQFEKVNKTNISLSLITITIEKHLINYLKKFVNETKIKPVNVISNQFKIVNLLLDNLYNPYITKKHYFYQIKFKTQNKYNKNNTFCAPIDYIDKYDKENYCKTYFKKIYENKKLKEEIIICECNIFTQIGVFENETFANFYKKIQFDKNKYKQLLSNIILITSLGMISFFSIVLLCYDINEENKMEKIKNMNEEIEKVKYYYDKISYLYKLNVISFSWNLFYFYCPFCQIFNIYSISFPRHIRFMIELIKILLTLIISLLKYRNGDNSKIIDFINKRNFDEKEQSIHLLLLNEIKTQIISFVIALFIYFIISIIFDYIYKLLGNESIYEGKWKSMKTLITNFTYDQVNFECLFNEKWEKIRIKIFALSKICGESILKGLNRKDKFSKYLNFQKDLNNLVINDSNILNNSNLKQPLLDKSETYIEKSYQTSVMNLSNSNDKKKLKYKRIKQLFQKYNTIQKRKKEGNNNNDINLNSYEKYDFTELNNNSNNLFWNIFSHILLIFFIFFFEIILKNLVDEVSELYGLNLVFIWYIPTIILIVFYNLVINYLVCILISFIFFKSYYRTPSKIKKWFINKLIRNYRYFYKIMILISKNKTDIDFTIKNIMLEKLNK